MKYNLDCSSLEKWFNENKRDLPWRISPSPYSVWVSEVMLQQTQAAVVAPYFLLWMNRFPAIESLAKANLEEVIKLWEGLGYYSRARYLHAGAQHVVAHHQGQLPKSKQELSRIKGLGDYTIGAILSFAFHQRAPAVDGNVLRVMTRYYALEDDISKAGTKNKIAEILSDVLPENTPWITMEAIIELGATVCQKKPNCAACPMNKSCDAFAYGKENELPINSRKIKIERLNRAVAIIHCEKNVLVKQVEKGKIMEGLYEFPYFELEQPSISEIEFSLLVNQQLNLKASEPIFLPQVKHGFTRYHVELFPGVFHITSLSEIDGYHWTPLKDIHNKAFSSGHRSILQNMLKHLNI